MNYEVEITLYFTDGTISVEVEEADEITLKSVLMFSHDYAQAAIKGHPEYTGIWSVLVRPLDDK